MQQFQARPRGSLFCLCVELDPLAPKVRARCGGSSLLSGQEILEGCSHVELIRGKVLVYSVVDSEFSLRDD